MKTTVFAVVGNPNSGKTSFFNAVTGSHQRVGNWPGVTVERKEGDVVRDGRRFTFVDLPGIYDLDGGAESSLDERIARDFIQSGAPEVLIDIVDANNLERNLHLTTQAMEMGIPVVVALNMVDVAERRGNRIDIDALATALDCPVVPIVASRGKGIDRLLAVAAEAADAGRSIRSPVRYAPALEREAETLAARMIVDDGKAASARWLALRMLADTGAATPEDQGISRAEVRDARDRVRAETGEDVDILLADARFRFAAQAAQDTVIATDVRPQRTLTERLDAVFLNQFLGIPLFLGIVYLMFMVSVNVAGAFIDFFDIAVGTFLVDGVGAGLRALNTPEWIIAVLADCVGGGVQTVATFIPVIAGLYLILSFLEGSGYMARAAFLMDRVMRAIGLPGKAFVPLIVGFGCNVPAVMAARTLNRQRDRILTVLMAPFMSCGARLPVYALFAVAFFPQGGQNIVFALYLIGIAAALGTGFILRRTVLAGQSSPLVMELPPYHLPSLSSVLRRTWDRLRAFVVRAGRVIVAMVVVLGFLNSIGTDGSFGNQDSERSALSHLGRALTPLVAPMGLTEENWPATVGLFTGVFAKEAVVGTLDSLYAASGNAAGGGAGEEAAGWDPLGSLGEAFATIPANLGDALAAFSDPLGIGIGDTSDVAAAAETQGVTTDTIGAMASRFDGAIGAFAYLLAVLLYMPCVAVVAAIHREIGGKWAIFASLWTTGVGYAAAVLAYQAGTFTRHPGSSAAWIAGVILALAAIVAILRFNSRDDVERRNRAFAAAE